MARISGGLVLGFAVPRVGVGVAVDLDRAAGVTDLARVLGKDPGNLRLHSSLRAQQAAEAMGARAFAVGEKDIYLSSEMAGKLDTPEGFAVLAHEATHTMQEQNAVGFSRPGKAHDALEREARQVENRVLAQDDPGSVAAMHEGGQHEESKAEAGGLTPDQLLTNMDDRQRRMIAKKVRKILDDRRRLEADRMGRPSFS